MTTVRGDGGREELAQEGGCDQTGPRCGWQNWSRKQETGATASGWAKLNHGVPQVSAFWTTVLTLRNTIRQHGANHLRCWWCPVVLIYKTKRNRTVGQTSQLSQRYTFPSHDFWVACLYPTVCLINLSNFWSKVYSSTKERGPNINYINSWNREQEGKKTYFVLYFSFNFGLFAVATSLVRDLTSSFIWGGICISTNSKRRGKRKETSETCTTVKFFLNNAK